MRRSNSLSSRSTRRAAFPSEIRLICTFGLCSLFGSDDCGFRVFRIFKLAEGPSEGRFVVDDERTPVEFTLLDDDVVEVSFLVGFAEESLFDCMLGDEAVYMDVTDLADTMRSG